MLSSNPTLYKPKQLSLSGELLLKGIEKLKLNAYYDQAKVVTIGWGTTRYENGHRIHIDDVITIDRAQELFSFEAKTKSYVLNEAFDHYHIHVNQNQFDACLVLAYNIGVPQFIKSTAFRIMKHNLTDPSISGAWLAYNKVTIEGKKVTSAGLIARRRKELKLYFTHV